MLSLQELVNIENEKGIQEFRIYFNNFLDELYFKIKNNDKSIENIFEKEPNWGNLEGKRRSWIVSAANHLISKSNGLIKRFKWMVNDKFVLEKPYFACDAKGMLRLVLLAESPSWFRINNIYVTDNALQRV